MESMITDSAPPAAAAATVMTTTTTTTATVPSVVANTVANGSGVAAAVAVGTDLGSGGGGASSGGTGSAAMEQFLILAKTCKGLSAVELIRQVVESPHIYVFGEFLDIPNIGDLANNCDHKPYYDLLVLFAFGQYSDYLANVQTLPELSAQMRQKLRHLTIVSMATKSKHIPYGRLLEELDMKNLRELEDLIIDVIYAGVVTGKMDQLNNRLEVEQTIGRDIRRGDDLKVVANILAEWCRNCDNVLRNIEQQILNANRLKEDNHKQRQQLDQQVSTIKKTIKSSSSSGGGGGADMDDPMTTDLVNSSPRDHREAALNFEKIKRSNITGGGKGKGSGLRGSGTKFWKRDNN
ncbi:COP9 signalosome complex subunit 7b-like [Oppia nitens]|uniref:COP9 signalosome complex subunit 7b-like n=1 Tax=Oppia nitens TaxID=1686743 RepID=UPI0023D9F3C3|nr:COP9 signalosome complex subunit 7b-like [Oppia nitens]